MKFRTYEPTPDEGDRFPQAMIEASTEYDWDDLPDWLKDVMRNAADEFRRWADDEPIRGQVVGGELANELEAPDAR